MTAPNVTTLWGRTIADELAKAGVTAACIAPGSRSTPLTVAIDDHPGIGVFSVLDERSAAFFALGRGRRTGESTAVVCTSGTAAANFHPAVVEATRSRVPLLVLTADRPRELQDSGANQTVDQEKLYGDAVRMYRTLPDPAADARTLRSLRTTVCRAAGTAAGTPPGPVHLNVPVRKPLEPTEVPGDVPADLAAQAPLAVEGRDGPFVEYTRGRPTLADDEVADLAATLAGVDRALLVAGPMSAPPVDPGPFADLAATAEVPVLADPLSGLRFGEHVNREGLTVCGGYDSYLDGAGEWPTPEVVLRVGASPTSKVLRRYLRDRAERQVVVDPAGGWREAEFTATDLLVADPERLAGRLAAAVSGQSDEADGSDWRERFAAAERAYWDRVEAARETETFEGEILADALAAAPDPATVFVSNSMPVRDADRFGRPRRSELTVLGNRGASGIDGITSTALGAGSATADPLVLVTGDLAYYHDMNGLLSLSRCGVDATIVLVNNDGGGIFHILPIEDFDPPFTDQFRTPHGMDFEPTGDLYDLEFQRVRPAGFRAAYESSLSMDGTQVVEVVVDGEASHRARERVHEQVCDEIP